MLSKEIISEIRELENVEDIEIRVQGKIIYTTTEFLAGTNLDVAKEVAQKTLESQQVVIDKYTQKGL